MLQKSNGLLVVFKMKMALNLF